MKQLKTILEEEQLNEIVILDISNRELKVVEWEYKHKEIAFKEVTICDLPEHSVAFTIDLNEAKKD